MKFDDVIRKVAEHGVFRTGQILSGEARPSDVRRQLDRWVRSGKVMQLRRGVYMLSETYVKSSPHPFLVSNMLKRASYISLQSALAHYGMIPEYVPVTTGVTTGRPEELSTFAGRFQFRHVATPLFRGFTEVEVVAGQRVRLATPYKALIDLLYLVPHSDEVGYLRELRLSRPAGFDDSALALEADRSGSGKVVRAVARLADAWEDI